MSKANYLLKYLIQIIKKPSCSSSYGTGYGTDLSQDLTTTAGYKIDHDRGEK